MLRTIQSIAGVAFSLALTAALAGQQAGQTAATKAAPAPPTLTSSAVTLASPGTAAPMRVLQTRTESAGREIVTETVQALDLDGAFRLFSETTTETIRLGSDSVQTKREVFGPDPDGRRRLIETTQAQEDAFPDGSSRALATTWNADLNGRLELTQRELKETKPAGANVIETDITISRPGINEPLRETERVQQTERKVSSDVVQNDTSRSFRDSNGRWQAFEIRNEEVRAVGANESIEEETILRPNANSVLTPWERRITRRSAANGQDLLLTETYSQNLATATYDPVWLNQRIRVTTTAMPDGGRQTIQEVEARSPIAPGDPLRVVERTVETVRAIGANQWEIQREVFALDGNGRLSLAVTEGGQAVGK